MARVDGTAQCTCGVYSMHHKKHTYMAIRKHLHQVLLKQETPHTHSRRLRTLAAIYPAYVDRK